MPGSFDLPTQYLPTSMRWIRESYFLAERSRHRQSIAGHYQRVDLIIVCRTRRTPLAQRLLRA